MSALHLGCTPWTLPIGAHAGELVRQAQFAEGLGYASFWLPESHFNGAASIPDPLMLLAAVAAATTRIRLATTSYLLPLRHPLQAAEQVAVLDQLSGGRVILGIGRGFAPELFEAFKLPRKEKRAMFSACLDAMRAAWSGEPVASGNTQLAPRPVQQPHPPIWVAAFGPKALAQAGALGLPYLASPIESLSSLQRNFSLHREACAAAGHAQPRDVPLMRTVFVSDDAAELARVRAELQQQMATLQRQRSMTAQVEDWAIVGTADQVHESIARYRKSLGITHLIVTRLLIGNMDTAVLEHSLTQVAAICSDGTV